MRQAPPILSGWWHFRETPGKRSHKVCQAPVGQGQGVLLCDRGRGIGIPWMERCERHKHYCRACVGMSYRLDRLRKRQKTP